MTLTAEIMADIKTPTGARISPDGTQVIVSVGTNSRAGKHPKASLWLAFADGREARQVTAGLYNDTGPQWSPDGRRIAFLSDRAKRGTSQLWVLGLDGGEALPLTDEPGGVSSFVWVPGDQERIAIITPDAEDPDEVERRRERGDDANVFGAFWPYGRLVLLDLATGSTQRIEIADRHIFDLAPAPDGRKLAIVSSELPTLDSMGTTARLSLVDLDSGDVADVASLNRRAGNLVWSRDSERVFYLAGAGEDPAVSSTQLWSIEVKSNAESRLLTADLPACLNALDRGRDDSRVIATVHQGVDSAVYALDTESGEFHQLAAHDGDLIGISVSDDGGRITTLRSTPTRPHDVFLGPPNGELQRVTHLHDELAGIEFGPQLVITWERAGFTLDGILIWPPGKSDEDGPLPTAVSIHGGPYGRWANAFAYSRPFAHWLAAQGYLVFMPNARGGSGHGQAFAGAVRNCVGDQDWQDILAGVDLIVERGYADPERMGIGGWSQGGFMTAWAIGHTDRFKCAVMGAGVSDWGMMIATSDLPTFQQALGGGNPYESVGPHEFDRWSPISYVHRATTPTLIVHGENDERVPVSQAIFMHRGLTRYGVETELVTYPREPHGLQERQHVIDLHQRVAGWYRRWIPLE